MSIPKYPSTRSRLRKMSGAIVVRAVRFKASPSGLAIPSSGRLVEKLHDPALQRILGTHHHQALILDQLFQHRRSVPEVIDRGMDVGTHGSLDQRLLIIWWHGANQPLHRG